MKTIAHYNLDLEVIKELNRLFPSGQRSNFVNNLLKAYFEEIKKSPEGVHSLRHEEENPQSIQDQEVI